MAPHVTAPSVEDYTISLKPKSVNGSKLNGIFSTEYGAQVNDTNVLTGPFVDGLVMRSARSTSEPKIVYWARHEFLQILSKKAEIMSKQSVIIPGDRIANLSHMSGMYGGFMFTNQALMEMPTDNVHLPITTVMISTVYATAKLASWLKEQGRTLPSVRLILFIGEAFFKDVRDQWTQAFPNALIGPYIYGSVKCGPVASPANAPRPGEDDDSNPLYNFIREVVYMEITDENGVAITKLVVRGTVVVTHLIKKLQQAIRYPIGDTAAWEDYAEGTFRLYGRVSVALKNVLVFRVVHDKSDNAEAIRTFIEADIAAVSQTWIWNKEAGQIGDLKIEYIHHDQLIMTPGSGKLKSFVEERYE
ncbi:AMP-dependent synthetase/ligase [Fusarium tricinctum]|uniref:AMP-dependent synthetase/ligase n=1 Tax=Fusarium tricinctum TaxID=61284 RepID=A0A8K0RMP7_9HYPO|nr:AMP-dependent synthetase/ligase [Fusarium tricinctum]